jgi:hypothetical protein
MVKVNKREVSKDTEQDVVLVPASYWRLLLKPKLAKLLDRKLAKNRPVKSEDTNIVISVNERSQHDLVKRFDGTNIDWSVIVLVAQGDITYCFALQWYDSWLFFYESTGTATAKYYLLYCRCSPPVVVVPVVSTVNANRWFFVLFLLMIPILPTDREEARRMERPVPSR